MEVGNMINEKDICSFFSKVTFSKKIMHGISENLIKEFAYKIIDIMAYSYQYIRYGNITDQIIVPKGLDDALYNTVLKGRLDSANRLFFYISTIDGERIFNLIKITNHDTQGSYIRLLNNNRLEPGKICWNTNDFLRRIYFFIEQKKYTSSEFSACFNDETKYVYDEEQKSVLSYVDKAINLSVIGNAGSGKSVIGESWLKTHMQRSKVLYLTMSDGLTNARRDVYVKQKEILRQEGKIVDTINDNIVFYPIFDFLTNYASNFTDKKFTNPQDSYDKFRDIYIMARERNKHKGHNENEEKIQFLWRQIHGIVKGNIPNRADVDSMDRKSLSDKLSIDEYTKQKRTDVSDAGYIYEIYTEYQRMMDRQKKYDDNDLARFILANCPETDEYEAVFIDECQDLTEIQLMSLFHILRKCKHRLLSSDRCQMVHPTYFDAGVMIQIANMFVSKENRNHDPAPVMLNYNYRSVDTLVAFQAEIVKKIGEYSSLRVEEKQDIFSIYEGEFKPVWIVSSEDNRDALLDLWCELDDVRLQIITSREQDVADDIVFSDYIKTGSRRIYDAITCKGMEFTSVMLWNVLSGHFKCDSTHLEWAWRNFYVGATRAQNILIIYEESDDEDIISFLEKSYSEGLIEKIIFANDLRADNGIFSKINTINEEAYLERAKKLCAVQEYDAAIKLYKKFGHKFDKEIQMCIARDNIKNKKYSKALDVFFDMEVDRSYFDEIMLKPDVDAETYYACLMYLHCDKYNTPQYIYSKFNDFAKKHRIENVDFTSLTTKVCQKYSVLMEKMLVYQDAILSESYISALTLNDKLTPDFLRG